VDQAIVGAVWRLWPRAQIEDTPLGQSRLTSHELVAGASLNCIFASTPTVVAVAVAVAGGRAHRLRRTAAQGGKRSGLTH